MVLAAVSESAEARLTVCTWASEPRGGGLPSSFGALALTLVCWLSQDLLYSGYKAVSFIVSFARGSVMEKADPDCRCAMGSLIIPTLCLRAEPDAFPSVFGVRKLVLRDA